MSPEPRPRRRRVLAIVAPLLTLLATVAVAIPLAIVLTPDQETTVAGQYVAVGGSTPTGGWFGDVRQVVDDGPTSWTGDLLDGLAGPAQLRQIGQTTVDIDLIQVRGPLRPRLALGPLVQTRSSADLLDPDRGPAARREAVDAVVTAFRTWYGVATLLVLALALAVVALCTLARIWRGVDRAGRGSPHAFHEVWRTHARRLRRDAVIAVVGALAAWGVAGYLAYHDTAQALVGVSSVRDLVGAEPVRLQPAGRVAKNVTGAVIGDSRASRVGGPPVADPDHDETACDRSSDSLAAQLSQLSGDRVLNLACPSATITSGLLDEQRRSGEVVPPQVSRLLQLPDLKYVAVMIGPNDLAWAEFLRYCYAVDQCDDKFTSGQFDYRLAAFDRAYGDLLAALSALPTKPQVIIVGSYDVFAPDADCAETRGPAGHPGLDADNLALLRERNDQLNTVLRTGAEAYGFTSVVPQLATLCQTADPQVGRDLQGLEDRYPFHPTGVGMVRLAASVFAAVGADGGG